MTDFEYPPTATYELGTVLADVEDQLKQLDEDDEAAGDEDESGADEADLGDSRDSLERTQHALQWAVYGDDREDGFDGWGADATITLTASTATSRAEILDTLNRATVGPVGENTVEVWFVAGHVESAPWLDGGEDLQTRHQITGNFPPALQDWLRDELDELNGLTEGN
jgi:hypothetical protein